MAKADRALIVALAKKEAAKGPSRKDDYEGAADGILAAIKSGSKKELAKALRALQEISRGDPDTEDD